MELSTYMGSWVEKRAQRRRERIGVELERIERELGQLRLEIEACSEAGEWMRLGDGLEEQAEGEAWLRHKLSLETAIGALETRSLELRSKL